MLNIKKYRAQAEREISGVWFDYEGARLLVSFIDNPEYSRMLAQLQMENIVVLRAGGPTAEKLQRTLLEKAVAHKILRNWENVQEDDSEEQKRLAYTPELGMKYFAEMPKFFHDVLDMANKAQRYKDEVLEQDSKN